MGGGSLYYTCIVRTTHIFIDMANCMSECKSEIYELHFVEHCRTAWPALCCTSRATQQCHPIGNVCEYCQCSGTISDASAKDNLRLDYLQLELVTNGPIHQLVSGPRCANCEPSLGQKCASNYKIKKKIDIILWMGAHRIQTRIQSNDGRHCRFIPHPSTNHHCIAAICSNVRYGTSIDNDSGGGNDDNNAAHLSAALAIFKVDRHFQIQWRRSSLFPSPWLRLCV